MINKILRFAPILPLLLSTTLAASVPTALTGNWSSGYSSAGLPAPVEYYDPETGKFSDASGFVRSLRIGADGTYESIDFMSVSTYGCTSKLFVQVKGTVRVSGDEIEFLPQTSLSSGYTCTPSKAYEKRNGVAASAKGWKIDTSGGKPVLVLTAPDGGASRYDRR